ncbi:hypothetical protein KVR01_009679 [Diaporthe batatas]|uniref:uncharacterized protein n=1 Tax=Diaporthe batatas TaxID=748121 RepID=UPI001D04E562|nr:uncharacterized protein KVR01_009679 [Diaporthe batatas]KAG8160143.1 hypothetical protein KVR01_009679 [Diaporthe batatas]
MRLLNAHTFEFEEFLGQVGNGIPPYTILSHTWGTDEVTFKDHTERGRDSTHKKGYDKIRGCCRLAVAEGFQYVWIDTCCIDKSSSAELSEAINSMFRWYRDAAICYAYLGDVSGSEDQSEFGDGDNQPDVGSSFARSRWFTRGWTLQELLAPSEVVFLAADWSEIGTKKSLRGAVSHITGISEKVLHECLWDEYSVAQKMSWAASRQTTRLEDEAYCLMGLFDVNMPLLYGEGRKAFSRLQQAIMQRTEDHSIFAWSFPDDEHSHTLMSGMMAPSPQYFKNSSQIEVLNGSQDYQGPFEVVNQLLRLRLRPLDDIQGIMIQTYDSNPRLHSVVEVQQGSKRPQVTPQDTRMSTPPARDHPPLVQGADRIPSFSGLSFEDGQIIEINVDGISPHCSTDDDRDGDSQAGDETVNLTPLGQPAWRWYIYETVAILPLRCRVGQSELGILLSKGPAHNMGTVVNLRLHNPSIVVIDKIRGKLEAAAVQTMYAAVSESPGVRLHDALIDLSWPEIRYHSLKMAGYRAVTEAGPAWVVEPEKDLVRSLHPQAIAHGQADYLYAPVVLFYHQSGKDSSYPTIFLRLMVDRGNDLNKLPNAPKTESLIMCDLGIYNPASARSTASMVEDFRIYSANLLQQRAIEVASGHNGHSVAVRLRQGHGIFFVSVSFQKAHHGRFQAPEDISDTPEIRILKTQLFSKLRSARGSFIEL